MATLSSIPISALNALAVITASDYIPIVQSSSMTTYRTPITALDNWISSSVAASSSVQSFSASYAANASSASHGITSSFSFTSNALNYPNSSTASRAVNANFSVSASWASRSFSSTSASFASMTISASFADLAITSSRAISASWAPPTPTDFSISASWASHSVSSDTSISSSFSTSASFASNTYWGSAFSAFPYISSIAITSSHDDFINLDFYGLIGLLGPNRAVVGWSNQPSKVTHSFEYDSTTGFYKSSYPAGKAYWNPIQPIQSVTMWVDNRGGGAYNWFFTGSIVVTFAITPTSNITHKYTPVFATNYAGMSMKISAIRAKLGLNAIQNQVSLEAGIITNMFPTFTIS